VFERARTARLELWRAVEAQHVVSTMVLVDTEEEQQVLEELLEGSKPPVPDAARGLHYLLFTPFRYPPVHRGSRFRHASDPGVFYGADLVRTACAELGYWRWRFLRDSPDLPSLEPGPQTVFRVAVRARTIDLRRPPHRHRRSKWTDPSDYTACQQLGRRAREAGIAVIRYESVRDPERGGCGAVLTPAAFARRAPLEQQTWYLTVSRERVRWHPARAGPGFQFEAAGWS
jgi:hypothetical protein